MMFGQNAEDAGIQAIFSVFGLRPHALGADFHRRGMLILRLKWPIVPFSTHLMPAYCP